jgi:hypothetical protein
MVTTVNLPVSLIEQVTQIAKPFKLKKSSFIALCLLRKIDTLCSSIYVYEHRAVEYQPRGVKYKKIKVDFSWDEYDSNLLCRFFRKFSVSLLTSMAIIEYAKEIEEELLKENVKANNYSNTKVVLSKLILTEDDIMSGIITKYQIIQKTPHQLPNFCNT